MGARQTERERERERETMRERETCNRNSDKDPAHLGERERLEAAWSDEKTELSSPCVNLSWLLKLLLFLPANSNDARHLYLIVF